MNEARCFFAGHGPCDGALIKAHLIPRQLLRREYRYGALLEDGQWRKADRYEVYRYGALLEDGQWRTADDLCDDMRTWVPCCGGPQGVSGHHGQVDGYQLEVTRDMLPAAVEEFAEQFGLGWYLDRRYGLRTSGPRGDGGRECRGARRAHQP